MTEVSKEAVEALAKAVWPLTTVNGEVTEMSRVASLTVADRLSKLGYTIAPIAQPVSDEKLREAVDALMDYQPAEMKPCPFCGKDPQPYWNGLGCTTVGCALGSQHIEWDKWQTRTSPTPPMTEAELEREACYLHSRAQAGNDTVDEIMALAKKYRGYV